MATTAELVQIQENLLSSRQALEKAPAEAEAAAAAQLKDLRARASGTALYSTDVAKERAEVLQSKADTIRRSTDDLNAVTSDLTSIQPAIANQQAYEAQQKTYTDKLASINDRRTAAKTAIDKARQELADLPAWRAAREKQVLEGSPYGRAGRLAGISRQYRSMKDTLTNTIKGNLGNISSLNEQEKGVLQAKQKGISISQQAAFESKYDAQQRSITGRQNKNVEAFKASQTVAAWEASSPEAQKNIRNSYLYEVGRPSTIVGITDLNKLATQYKTAGEFLPEVQRRETRGESFKLTKQQYELSVRKPQETNNAGLLPNVDRKEYLGFQETAPAQKSKYPYTVQISGGTATIENEAQEKFYNREQKRQDIIGGLTSLPYLDVVNEKSEGAKNIKQYSRLVTFGGTNTEGKRETLVGRSAEMVVSGAITWPAQLGVAVYSAGSNIVGAADAAINVRGADFKTPFIDAWRGVESTSYSFLPGGTPINEEGVSTLVFAAGFGLLKTAGDYSSGNTITWPLGKNTPSIKPGVTPPAPKPKGPSFFRVETKPDAIIQQRLGVETSSKPGVSIKPSEKGGVVIRVPEPQAKAPLFDIFKTSTAEGQTAYSLLFRDKPIITIKDTAKPSATNTLKIVDTAKGPEPGVTFKVKTPEPKTTTVRVFDTAKGPEPGLTLKVKTPEPNKIKINLPTLKIVDTAAKPKQAVTFNIKTPEPKTTTVRVFDTAKGPEPAVTFKINTPEPKTTTVRVFDTAPLPKPGVTFRIPTLEPRTLTIDTNSVILGRLLGKQTGYTETAPKVKPVTETTTSPAGPEVETGAGNLVTVQKTTQTQTPISKPALRPGLIIPLSQPTITNFNVLTQETTTSPQPVTGIKPAVPVLNIKPIGKTTLYFSNTSKPKIDQGQRTRPISRIEIRPRAGQFESLEQLQDQAQIDDIQERQDQRRRIIPAIVQRTTSIYENKPPELPPILPPLLTKKNNKQQANAFGVSVRRRGKFQQVAGGLSFKEAALKGALITGTTAAASFKITGGKSSKDALSIVGGRFTRSKKNKGVFVEKNLFRIDTPGELAQITRKGQASKKSKRGRLTWV